MKFEKKDLIQAENVAKALRKAKYDVNGDEVLALSQMFNWVGGLIIEIKKELEEQSPAKQIGQPSGLLKPKSEEEIKKEQEEKKRKPRRRATVKNKGE